MAQQEIGVGTTADDGTGDTDRDAWIKVNENFDEVYAGVGSSVRESSGADTSTDADFGNYVILLVGDTPTLHSTTDTDMIGKKIEYISDGLTELTFQAGGTTMKGNTKINQNEGVTVVCTAVGAGTDTVLRIIGAGP